MENSRSSRSKMLVTPLPAGSRPHSATLGSRKRTRSKTNSQGDSSDDRGARAASVGSSCPTARTCEEPNDHSEGRIPTLGKVMLRVRKFKLHSQPVSALKFKRRTV